MGKTKKKTPSQLGRASRRKGKAFEQLIAREIREMFLAAGSPKSAEAVKRGWQTREGHDAADIEGTPYWIETKHHQRVNVQKAMKQAVTASLNGTNTRPPLLVTKDTGQGAPLAVLEWADFRNMWGRLVKLELEAEDREAELTRTVQQLDDARHGNLPRNPETAEKRYDTPETVATKAKVARSVLDSFNAVFRPAQPPRVNGAAPIIFGSKEDPGVADNDGDAL